MLVPLECLLAGELSPLWVVPASPLAEVHVWLAGVPSPDTPCDSPPHRNWWESCFQALTEVLALSVAGHPANGRALGDPSVPPNDGGVSGQAVPILIRGPVVFCR